jgi:hypothetical protein
MKVLTERNWLLALLLWPGWNLDDDAVIEWHVDSTYRQHYGGWSTTRWDILFDFRSNLLTSLVSNNCTTSNVSRQRNSVSILVFVVTPCGHASRCQRFGGTHCLHRQPWRWKQYIDPKRWYLPINQRGVLPRRPASTSSPPWEPQISPSETVSLISVSHVQLLHS